MTVLINHLPRQAIITTNRQRYVIPQGLGAECGVISPNGVGLVLSLGTNTYRYEAGPAEIPSGYVEHTAFGPPIICLQLESDLGLYLVPGGRRTPWESLPHQPVGFPIRPMR